MTNRIRNMLFRRCGDHHCVARAGWRSEKTRTTTSTATTTLLCKKLRSRALSHRGIASRAIVRPQS